ncbi:MAG: hypothetical protein ACTSPD_14395 [Promethearchaeota archaeon]
MRNNIFVLTENLNFFYCLNRELKHLNIIFKVLNIGGKIPELPFLILTTSEELKKFQKPGKKFPFFLAYNKEDNFEQYILKVLAAYRIGYKDVYSKLIFAIDPGTKYIGLVVFLDDIFLISHTFYNREDFFKKVKNYVNFFQKDKNKELLLNFKFGKGVLSITEKLIKEIYEIFKSKKKLKIYLIDETKSSKIRIQKNGANFPKHEASALIISLRGGMELQKSNYSRIFSQIKSKSLKTEEFDTRLYENFSGNKLTLNQLAEKVLLGEISLKELAEITKE